MFSVGMSDIVLRALREGMLLVLLVSAPALLASLVIGFVVNVVQSATQIQDPSIAFVPKLIAVLLVLLAMGPLLGAHMLRFAQSLLLLIPLVR